MRRVLYLMANATPGGAERATMLMLGAHDRRRYEPAVLFFSHGPLLEEARQMGLEVHCLSRSPRLRRPWSLARTIGDVSRIVTSGAFSLVHSCMAYAHLLGGPIAWRSGVPGVLYQHGPLGAWMDGAATLVGCDAILVNSAFTRSEQQAHSWRKRPVTVAPYGINTRRAGGDELAALRAIVDERHDVPRNATVIGIMARFDPWKGIDIALKAAAPLLRARTDLRFMVVGDQYRHFHPGYGALLRRLVEDEGVAGQVVFAGFQMDVRPYLARMTVLVHSSVQPEPFGLTIIEALASGVPVVAARAGGAAEILDDGVDGLFHTPGRVAELRAALESLLDDAAMREAFAAAGLRKIDARYRPTSMMRIIEAVYDDVLSGHPSPSIPATGLWS